LEILTNYSEASKTDWIEPRTRVNIAIRDTLVDHKNGTRRIFTGWYRDGSLFSKEPNCSFVIDEPMTLVAGWNTEHRVQTSSERGTATGGGWYLAGSSAAVSISPTTIQKDFLTNYVFEGWMADGKAVSNSVTYSFTVTGPMSLSASWKTELNYVMAGGILVGVVLVAIIALFLLRGPKRSVVPPPPALT